jgi:hypothetical protein
MKGHIFRFRLQRQGPDSSVQMMGRTFRNFSLPLLHLFSPPRQPYSHHDTCLFRSEFPFLADLLLLLAQ